MQIPYTISRDILVATLVFFTSLIGFYILKYFVLSYLIRISKNTQNQWDDAIISTVNTFSLLFYAFVSLFIGLQFVVLSKQVTQFLNASIIVVVTIYAARSVNVFLTYAIQQILRDRSKKYSLDEGIQQAIKFSIRLLVWTFALLLVLQNLGYNITALIGGLGVAGIAVGLAVQNILNDMLSFFSIHFDRPFKIGDFIIIGDDMGTVEKIGIKSTRIKSLQGQQLIIPNQELTSTRINNYQRMSTRRIVFEFGVTYETPKNKLEKIPTLISEVVKKVKKAEIDRAHFKSFGNSALIYEVVYIVQDDDYNIYMDVQQEINFGIVEIFKKARIEMAYPTQTVYMHKLS